MSLRHRLAAWAELSARYRRVFAHAWAERGQLAMPKLSPDEADFLPAALALQAAPVSPMGRWVARILMIMVMAALAWSIFGRIDIVVDAQGRIVSSGRTKTITSSEVGVVRSLHVVDGQVVKAGDPLLEFDRRTSESDHDKAVGDQQMAQLQEARSRAFLTALETGATPRLGDLPGIPVKRFQDAQHQLDGQWRNYLAKNSKLDEESARFANALPLAAQRANDYQALAEQHDVSQHAWSEKEQARIDLEGQLRDAYAEKAALKADTRKSTQETLYDAQRVLGDASQDARRAEVHGELLVLKSPVDGTVQQLAIHTIGAAVPAAQPLMEIVPAGGPVEVETMLGNKDIGFVVEGQPAEVKIETFSYTKYGTVPGHVVRVSRDAIQDDKKNWQYAVTIALDRPTLMVEGRQMPLTPGMTATVDIRTGDRRVIEYVLSPLIEHAKESLHER